MEASSRVIPLQRTTLSMNNTIQPTIENGILFLFLLTYITGLNTVFTKFEIYLRISNKSANFVGFCMVRPGVGKDS